MENLQAKGFPLIAEGCDGIDNTVTANDLDVPEPQIFDGVTETVPEALPMVTVTWLLPWPDRIVQSAGNAQV